MRLANELFRNHANQTDTWGSEFIPGIMIPAELSQVQLAPTLSVGIHEQILGLPTTGVNAFSRLQGDHSRKGGAARGFIVMGWFPWYILTDPGKISFGKGAV